MVFFLSIRFLFWFVILLVLINFGLLFYLLKLAYESEVQKNVCEKQLYQLRSQCLTISHKQDLHPVKASDPLHWTEQNYLAMVLSLQTELERWKPRDWKTINTSDYVSFVISLEKRQDRRNYFFKAIEDHDRKTNGALSEIILKPQYFKATDISSIQDAHFWQNGEGSPMISMYGPDFPRPGAYGCYLSHMNLFRSCKELHPNKHVFIFEDDAIFHPQFVDIYHKFIHFVPPDWDILYLGGILWDKPVPMDQFYYKRVTKMGHTHAYIVNAKSVEKMLHLLESFSVKMPLDMMYSELIYNHTLTAYCPFVRFFFFFKQRFSFNAFDLIKKKKRFLLLHNLKEHPISKRKVGNLII